ncbi:MAG: transglutaminase-like domain-containing protein [Thermodesulfobacteriota bacterium]
METPIDPATLSPTAVIDSDNETIIAFAAETIRNPGADDIEKAVALFYAVRDGIYYDPYYPFYLPEHYRASNVLKSGKGYCVSKAVLLCALGRAAGIPSRLGFATVTNHLATKQLVETLGSNIFVYHGFTELHLDGKWVKATPTFNIELCHRHNVAPLDFNGREDSIFHAYDRSHKRFMEYLEFHGSYADLPLEQILSAWKKVYGEDRVNLWIQMFENAKPGTERNFMEEDVHQS